MAAPTPIKTATRIVRLNPADIMMVCLSYLEVMPSAAHLRYAMRRIRRRVPNTKILIGLWGNERPDVVARELTPGIVADEYANSLRQALAVCIDAACVDLMDERQPPDPGPSLPKPSAA